MTICLVEYRFKIAGWKKNLLSLHPCLEDLEGLNLLWIPDSEQSGGGRKLHM